MRWSPWPGYYARAGFGRGYYWGSGISVGFGFFFGGIDWRQRHVNVTNRNSFYYRNVNRGLPPGNGWQHDPAHRRGVPYRNPALRQQFTGAQAMPASPDTRRDFRGRVPGSGTPTEPGGRGQPRPNTAGAPVANAAPGATNPNASQQALVPGSRPLPRDAVPGNAARPYSEQRPQALDGVGRGQDARNASARGQASFPARPPAAMQQRQAPTNNPPASPQPRSQAPRSAPAPAQQPAHTPPQPREQKPAPSPHNEPRQRGEPQK
jgi:hypothetical protein